MSEDEKVPISHVLYLFSNLFLTLTPSTFTSEFGLWHSMVEPQSVNSLPRPHVGFIIVFVASHHTYNWLICVFGVFSNVVYGEMGAEMEHSIFMRLRRVNETKGKKWSLPMTVFSIWSSFTRVERRYFLDDDDISWSWTEKEITQRLSCPAFFGTCTAQHYIFTVFYIFCRFD